MTAWMQDDQLDREVGRFLAWEADDVGAAPTATEMALRVGARVGPPAAGLRLSSQLGLLALVGLLLVALVGGLVAVGMFLRESQAPQPRSNSYEAVFLRAGSPVGGVTDVVVVGVNKEGVERTIATLGGTWVTGPWGAVSPSGLLAIGSGRGETSQLMHWEIFDLHRPSADPIRIPGIVQWFDELREQPYFLPNGRGGAFWGPGDRLALLWYHLPFGGVPDVQVAFIDGRTGNTNPQVIPDGLTVLPYWASDGSGIFASTNAVDLDPPGIDAPQILRPDGSVVDAPESLAEPSCRMPSGYAFACLSPDDSMIFVYFDALLDESGAPVNSPATTNPPGPGLIATGSGARFKVDGSFAGWLEIEP